jgi:thioredoxin 1
MTLLKGQPLFRSIAVLALIGTGLVLHSQFGTNKPSQAAIEPATTAKETLTTGLPSLLEFGMDSCASCRAMKSQLDKLRARHPDSLRVVSINLMEERELANQWRILAMPTQILLDANGQEVDRHLGFITADAILARFAVAGVSLDPPRTRP